MVKRFLITTALEETWPDNSYPVIFLGEWCKVYSRRSIYEKYNFLVEDYHWNDRNKVYSDYRDIQKIYKIFLNELTIHLNKIHNVEYSNRFWQIFIGPWLGYFIQVIFDRWYMLNKVFKNKKISNVIVNKLQHELYIPNDMNHFESLLFQDEWNEKIFHECLMELLSEYPDLKITEIKSFNNFKLNKTSSNSKISFKEKLKKRISKLINKISDNNGSFIQDSNLGIKNDFILKILLKEFPTINFSNKLPNFDLCSDLRKNSLNLDPLSFEVKHRKFISFLNKILFNHIPKVYLEGFKELCLKIKNDNLTSKPKLIFTSNSYWADDYFKAFTALNIEKNVPYIVGQHGGNFGISLFNFQEEHILETADKFITWGWGEEQNKRFFRLGNIKLITKKPNRVINGDYALFVQLSLPRYSYHLYSSVISSIQLKSYFDDQIRFIKCLNKNLRKKIILRLSENDYDFHHKERWIDLFPDLNIPDVKIPLPELHKKTRLFISTYNATTYLESLFMNIPTIIFWDKNFWELRDGRADYFKLLEEVGIFHNTPESAALKMEEIWENIEDWWFDNKTQKARETFCNKFSKSTNKGLKKLSIFLKQNKKL